MTQPSPAENRPSPAASPAEADADAREFAEFMAGQHPLDAEAADWQVRRQDGLSAGEEAEFQQWLAQHPSHQDSFDRLNGVWDRLDSLPAAGIAQLKAGLPTQSQTAPPPLRAPRPASPGRRAWLFDIGRWVPQIATAGIAFAIVGSGWWGWDYRQQQPVFSKTYATARGQQLDVQLPDGSSLKLDTATRAEVTLYRQRREVRLPEGQALFSIQPDASRPFDVLAGPLRITVVGTRFSVRHTQTGLAPGQVSVVVEEGRVRVAPAEAGIQGGQQVEPSRAVELTAGQAIQANAAGQLGPVAPQPPGAGLPWREGRVHFERTPLAQALAEFERYGATRLVVNDPAVGALRVQGSFDLRQLAAFAKALPQVLPVRLQTRDGVTEIVAVP